MNPLLLAVIAMKAASLRAQLVMAGRLAQTAIIAPFVFATAIPNAIDLGQAVVAWNRISGEITKIADQVTIATATLPAKWDSDDGRALNGKVTEFKTEIGQLEKGATSAVAALSALGAMYLALFTKLAGFVTAIITFLMSMAALQATPAGPAAKAAAEGAGITVVGATAAVIKMLVSFGAALGVGLAQGAVAMIGFNAFKQDTGKAGTPDIQEISLNWDLSKADPVPTKP